MKPSFSCCRMCTARLLQICRAVHRCAAIVAARVRQERRPGFLGPFGDGRFAGNRHPYGLAQVGAATLSGNCPSAKGICALHRSPTDCAVRSTATATQSVHVPRRGHGDEIWRVRVPDRLRRPVRLRWRACRVLPLVDGEPRLHSRPGRMLCCLGVADGKLRWKVDTHATYGVVQNFFGVSGVPVIDNDLLILPVGGAPPGPEPDDFRDLKGNGTGVVAFDKMTGKERYRSTAELASYSSPVVTDVGGKPPGSRSGAAPAGRLRARNGQSAISVPMAGTTARKRQRGQPGGDRRLHPTDRMLRRGSVLLRLKSGQPQIVWKDDPDSRRKRLECHWNTPIHVGGYIFGSSGRNSDNAELRCVEVATGNVKWRQPGLARASLVLVDNHLVVLTEFGQLVLVKPDPARYVEVARMDLGRDGRSLLKYPCWAAPVVAHGRLYLRGQDAWCAWS